MIEEPYFAPQLGGLDSPKLQKHDRIEASRIAAQEQMAYDRAIGGPPRTQLQRPTLKRPLLPQDFPQRIAALDTEIFERGIGVNADKLLSLGRERFQQLLAVARDCRQPCDVPGDLTRFESVQNGLHAYEAASVPRRTTREQSAGHGKEREAIRQISDWHDLHKFAAEPEPVTKALAFHDLFASLLFGQSLLERLSPDGRLRSKFFSGGKGRKIDLFLDWLPAVQGASMKVKLTGPLWSVVSWLANEKSPTPSPVELARDFYNVRSPSNAQERIAAATVDGFVLGLDDWPLWEYVGQRTRTMIDESRLSGWRKALAIRYRAVAAFHEGIRATFNKDVDSGDVRYAHREFDSAGYRQFIDRTVRHLLDCMSALLALGIDETFRGAVVARFQDWILVEGDHGLADKRVQIGLPLAKAFPAASFPIDFEEVQP